MIYMAWSREFAAKLADGSFAPTSGGAGSLLTITVVVWREHPQLGVEEAMAPLLTEFEKAPGSRGHGQNGKEAMMPREAMHLLTPVLDARSTHRSRGAPSSANWA